jgi:hypothetical protein
MTRDQVGSNVVDPDLGLRALVRSAGRSDAVDAGGIGIVQEKDFCEGVRTPVSSSPKV